MMMTVYMSCSVSVASLWRKTPKHHDIKLRCESLNGLEIIISQCHVISDNDIANDRLSGTWFRWASSVHFLRIHFKTKNIQITNFTLRQQNQSFDLIWLSEEKRQLLEGGFRLRPPSPYTVCLGGLTLLTAISRCLGNQAISLRSLKQAATSQSVRCPVLSIQRGECVTFAYGLGRGAREGTRRPVSGVVAGRLRGDCE